MTVDDEQADAAPVARAAGGTRRHDQLVGPWRADHRGLGAAQDVVLALTLCRGGNGVEIVARAPFGPGQRPNRFTRHDRRQEGLALRRRADILDQAAGEHHGLEKRLDHEAAAELLHHDHGRQRTAAKAAGALLKRRRAQAKLGEGIPVWPAPAFIARHELAAGVEIILVAQQALHARSQ